jgi:23S rRNA pseudouridine1911/1915/1917 synthase
MAKDASQIVRVLPAQVDQTLAAILKQALADLSWSDVRKLVRGRRVTVNGNSCLDPGRRLKLTDVVKVLEHPTAPVARPDDVCIRFLDAHLTIVEKPSGMTSVRHAEERGWSDRRKGIQPTLEDVLPRLIAEREGRGKRLRQSGPHKPPPVRPVHRLDRDTSGLMAFARTVPAERHLVQQFRLHTTQRRYLAVVLGRVAAQTISSRLVRDRGDGRRGSTTLPNVGKASVTHVKPIEWLDGYTLIECRLETGRTHQIRIHLAEMGHPVCGESVYNTPKFAAPIVDRSHAPRLALHATEIGLEHPVSGEWLQFEMPLPVDLTEFLERLREKSNTQREL